MTLEPNKRTGFYYGDFTPDLFSDILKSAVSPSAKYKAHTETTLQSDNGYVSNLGKDIEGDEENQPMKIIGFRAFKVQYIDTENPDKTKMEKNLSVIFKIKRRGDQSWNLMCELVTANGHRELGDTFRGKCFDTVKNAELIEIACFTGSNPAWKAICPKIFKTILDREKDIYVIAMEDLTTGSFSHMDTVNDVSQWSDNDIQDVFNGIAAFHASYYDKLETVPEPLKTLITEYNPSEPHRLEKVRGWYKSLVHYNIKTRTNLLDEQSIAILKMSITNVDSVLEIHR